MQTFSSGALTLQYAEMGPKDGEPVVLLHGFPQDSTSWSQVGELLAEAGYHVLIPDLRGYSPEAQPDKLSEYTATELVGDVIALLDSHGLETAHVVGHDWGGSLVWTMRKTDADRLTTATVVSTPHPAALSWAWTHTGQLLRSWYMGAVALPVLPEIVIKRRLASILKASQLPEDRADYYQELMNRPGVATGALNWYRQMLRDLVKPSSTAKTGHTSPPPPTLFIWGTEDAFFNGAVARKTPQVVRDLVYEEIVGGSHWLPETHPQELTELIMAHMKRA